MRIANHPYTGNRVTVSKYIAQFGHRRPSGADDRPPATCPICGQALSIVAASAPDSLGHFAHRKGSGFCPTKAPAGAPYTGLPPHAPDLVRARHLMEAFREKWRKHFSMLNWLVKGLSIEEFTDLIQLANRERIWEYAKLEEFQLPYVFATLMDFPPSRSYRDAEGKTKREKWFRCWFDATVKRYDDLWIHRETPLLFWRAWYEPPSRRGSKPRIEDMVNSYSMELDPSFLDRPTTVASYVDKRVSAWILAHFRIPN